MDQSLKRATVVQSGILFFLGLAALFAAKLQLIEGDRYYRLAEENRIKKKYSTAPRGTIYDRQGRILAGTRPGFFVSVIPAHLDTATFSLLASLLNTDLNRIKDRMRMEKNPHVSVKIAHDVSFEVVSILEERLPSLRGVEIGVEPLRDYPHRDLCAHLLGYVDEVTSSEISRSSDYRIGDYIGRAGIERQYEEQLRGEDGIDYLEVDAWGREVGPIAEIRPSPVVPGNDLWTTVDLALTESTAVYLEPYEKAAVVAMEPATGAVLVLYSKPGFDPNAFIHRLSQAQWDALNDPEMAPLFNRTIMSCYPCGSTFKPFVALAALQSRMVTPQQTFEPCRGGIRLGNRYFRCWKKHGSLRLVDAIVQSCDVYFYQLGRFVGVDTLHARIAALGFGTRTGIDLPQEKSGILPDRAWFESRYGKNWTDGHIFNLSIGQGDLLATPLQLACAYAAFANPDGHVPLPHLLRDAASIPLFPGARDTAFAIVRLGLQGVVSTGTGVLARLPAITVCGKTGTAENPHGDDHSLFVGYAPGTDAEIVVCVVVENAGHGGSVAAPIAGRILQAYFTLRRPP